MGDNTTCGFKHARRLGDCACCGKLVLDLQSGSVVQDLDFRRIHFVLKGGSLFPLSLCSSCLEHGSWDVNAITIQALKGWLSNPNPYVPQDFEITGLTQGFETWEQANDPKGK